MVIDDGGGVKVVTGVTEIGAGILTVVAQIAAHEIGVKPEEVVMGERHRTYAGPWARWGQSPNLHGWQRGRPRLPRGA